MAGTIMLRNRTVMIKAILLTSAVTILATIAMLIFFVIGGMAERSALVSVSSPSIIYNIFIFAFSTSALLFGFDAIRYCFAERYGTILPVSFAIAVAALVFKICYSIGVICDAPALQIASGRHIIVDAVSIAAIFIVLLYYCGLVSRFTSIISAIFADMTAITNIILAQQSGVSLSQGGLFCISYALFCIMVTLSAIYIKPVFKPVSDFDM